MSVFRLLPTISFPKIRTASALLLTGLFSVGAVAQQAADSSERWVSDSLSTYVRSGPTDGYRIVGTLTSGTKVELVRTQGDYSQVRGDSGDTVWIPTSDLQTMPGKAERLESLEQRAANLSAELEGINESWKTRVQGMQETLDSRKALIDELEAARSSLDSQLSQANAELRETKAQLGEEQQQVLMRYMVYGGSIAGAGLVAGLILPTMLRVRRKRNDQWI
ncbi:TIGR04211 family SH3 domain-containing protein [Pseudomonas sp. Marseille-QA0892]